MSKRITFITNININDLLNALIGMKVEELKIEEVNINSAQGNSL